MRHLLICAAALFACTPALAFAQSGHVELTYANNQISPGNGDFDAYSVGGQIALGGNFQIDGSYSNLDLAGGIDNFGVGAHAFVRGEHWLFGGYAGYDSLNDNADTSDWVVALETQYYQQHATISGALSYGETDDLDFTLTTLDGEYKYFVSERLSLSGGLSIGEAESFGDDYDVWGANVGGEYQFASAPISVFAGYRYANFDGGGVDQDNNTLTLGVRYDWGGSLQQRSQSGAGLNRVAGPFERLFGGY
jgi:hypothetical protein